MSLPVFTWVLDNSEERLGNRLVLLALAEHAHDDGTKAYPANATLMKRTRLSERAVRDCLRSLETNGSIELTSKLKNGTHVYRVIMAASAGGQNPPGAESGSQTAPEPSVTRQKTPPPPPRRGIAPTRIGGKLVSREEAEFAFEVLVVFNEVSGRSFGSKEALGKIILRHREHPGLAVADHRRIIEQQFKYPWWKGDPSPAVIYGNGDVFDRALNGVRGGRNNGEDDEPTRYATD